MREMVRSEWVPKAAAASFAWVDACCPPRGSPRGRFAIGAAYFVVTSAIRDGWLLMGDEWWGKPLLYPRPHHSYVPKRAKGPKQAPAGSQPTEKGPRPKGQ